jgi:hypothetical protein
MKDFAWALNKVKLELSIKDLNTAKVLNPALEINEETIKAQYVKRAGLVLTEEEIATTIPAPVPQKPVVRRPVVRARR